jgi:hypothetical protein
MSGGFGITLAWRVSFVNLTSSQDVLGQAQNLTVFLLLVVAFQRMYRFTLLIFWLCHTPLSFISLWPSYFYHLLSFLPRSFLSRLYIRLIVTFPHRIPLPSSPTLRSVNIVQDMTVQDEPIMPCTIFFQRFLQGPPLQWVQIYTHARLYTYDVSMTSSSWEHVPTVSAS